MKNIFFILLSFILLSFTHSFAQGNLQFNQVLLVGNSTMTVPATKVWKVESIVSGSSYPVTSNCTSASGQGDYSTAFYLNGVLSFPDRSYQTGSSGNFNMYSGSHSFPMWLPAATTLNTFCVSTTMTVIEFNIIP